MELPLGSSYGQTGYTYEADALPRMSPTRRREQAIYDQRASEFLRNTSATLCIKVSVATEWRW